MKILIDINHPAHVHYFRNFIKLMEAKGHLFCVVNRNSKIINQLLDYYGIEHTIRNKRPEKKGTIASLVYLLKMTMWCIRKSFLFHPDIYIGFASSACAITSWLFRKPSILLDDTEFNKMNHTIYMPFCSAVLTPFYFQKKLDNGNKQLYINAFIEQFFLHNKYYHKRNEIVEELQLTPQNYVLIRYSAFDAHHDLNIKPLSSEFKKSIIKEISKKYQVVLSLEKESDDSFYLPYLRKFPPEKMHDIEANAKFLITEGITMASEAFLLGVPYLLISPLKCGYIDYQTEHYPKLCHHSFDQEDIMNWVLYMISTDSKNNLKPLINEHTIDPTSFLVWFVENYPKSMTILKQNPSYQNQFI